MVNIHDFTQFCKNAHGNQTRWDGSSYFENHCVIVAQTTFNYKKYCPEKYFDFIQTRINELYCVGLAHDLIEDTDVSYGELERASSTAIANSVMKLTKPDGVTYANYISSLCSEVNQHTIMSLIVKQCDLEHNLSNLDKKQQQRRDKYELALMYIRHRISE